LSRIRQGEIIAMRPTPVEQSEDSTCSMAGSRTGLTNSRHENKLSLAPELSYPNGILLSGETYFHEQWLLCSRFLFAPIYRISFFMFRDFVAG
jgi:hypothetical protein